jgi:ParB family chromosome partitioning protein
VTALLADAIGKKLTVVMLETEKIRPNPNQPRREFDAEALAGLAQSIGRNGLLQPLTVRKTLTGYELIAGERRLRACRMAGMKKAPCIVINADDVRSAELALIENIQRRDLGFFEEAQAFAAILHDERLTQEELARSLGISQSAVANKLRLLRLSESERRRIISAGLSERHARALLRLDGAEREEALSTAAARGLNVAQTERLVEEMLKDKEDRRPARGLPVLKDIRIFINTFTNAVSVMRSAGIDAVAVRQENEEYLEYTVRIPKKKQARQAAGAEKSARASEYAV